MRCPIFIALLMVLTLPTVNAPRADDGATQLYPVRLLPTLPAQSVAEIDAALDEPFVEPLIMVREETPGDAHYDEPVSDSIETMGINPRIRYRSAANCREALAMRAAGFGFESWGLIRQFRESLSDYCVLLQYLKNARPSTRSFVGAFALDDTVPTVIPAALIFSDTVLGRGGHEDEAELARARTWNEARDDEFCRSSKETRTKSSADPCLPAPPMEVLIESPYEAKYLDPQDFGTPGEITDMDTFSPLFVASTLSLLGFADFNGDGVEDLVLEVSTTIENATVGEGAYWRGASAPPFVNTVWVLARFAPDERLKIVHRISACCALSID